MNRTLTNLVAFLVILMATPALRAELPQRTPEDTMRFQQLMQKGARYTGGRAYKQAYETFKKALKYESQDPDLYYNLAMLGAAAKAWSEVYLYTTGYFRFMKGIQDSDTAEIKKRRDMALEALEKLGKAPVGASVNTQPEGATVLIGDVFFGDSPIKELHLIPGKYEVKVYKSDFHPGKATLEVNPGGINDLLVTLEEIIYYGTIEIKTLPEKGVKVYVDDKLIGESPIADKVKVQANREHVIRMEFPGHDKWMRAVDIKPGKNELVDAALEETRSPEDDDEDW
jgi:hypothetical protein